MGEDGHEDGQSENIAIGDTHAISFRDPTDEEGPEKEGGAADSIHHRDAHARGDLLLIPCQSVDDRHQARDAQASDKEA